uniref:Uncharacterized protein n=1 Tax=Arundo donax TaxID=35708 RepID=A0A0A8ZDP3_ARUDO
MNCNYIATELYQVSSHYLKQILIFRLKMYELRWTSQSQYIS